MSCRTCAHFTTLAADMIQLGTNQALGECRRFPPQLSHLPTDNGGVQPFSGFPLVKGPWHCGEYRQQKTIDQPPAGAA